MDESSLGGRVRAFLAERRGYYSRPSTIAKGTGLTVEQVHDGLRELTLGIDRISHARGGFRLDSRRRDE